MSGKWVCQHPSCGSSEAQLAELRLRRPDGFEHDEDPTVRVCTVCRRLPLPRNGRKNGTSLAHAEPPLDASFLAGIKEELASMEENEQNIQSLSQVFRFYAGNAKQLVQLLADFITKQCFPWELIHALHLLDDILLMDNTGSYKTELKERIQVMTVHAFRKVQSDLERQEVARMLHAWRELKIFDAKVLSSIASTLRSNQAHSHILDEAEDDDEGSAPAAPAATAGLNSTPSRTATGEAAAKKAKVPSTAPAPRASGAPAAKLAPAAPKAPSEKVLSTISRILTVPLERPFELLGLKADCKASEIRTAYRKIALLIHPDKNPGFEIKCKEALIKLQQGREQAESDLQMRASGGTKKAASNVVDLGEAKPSNKCQYPGCDLPPCKQCPNRCCTRNITHCHMLARSKGGLHCFFHPPPRSWARNAEA